MAHQPQHTPTLPHPAALSSPCRMLPQAPDPEPPVSPSPRSSPLPSSSHAALTLSQRATVCHPPQPDAKAIPAGPIGDRGSNPPGTGLGDIFVLIVKGSVLSILEKKKDVDGPKYLPITIRKKLRIALGPGEDSTWYLGRGPHMQRHKKCDVRARAVAGIRTRGLLPHAYLPYHLTYTAIAIT
jgi:hypothetical protein